MKVRKLNEEGQKQFEEFIERTKDGESLPIPLNLLSDPKTSAAIADDLEVQKQTFESRYEIGLYLVSLFKHIEIEQYIGDRGFWDWFALYWFDQITGLAQHLCNFTSLLERQFPCLYMKSRPR